MSLQKLLLKCQNQWKEVLDAAWPDQLMFITLASPLMSSAVPLCLFPLPLDLNTIQNSSTVEGMCSAVPMSWCGVSPARKAPVLNVASRSLRCPSPVYFPVLFPSLIQKHWSFHTHKTTQSQVPKVKIDQQHPVSYFDASLPVHISVSHQELARTNIQTMKHLFLHAALLLQRADGALPVLAERAPHGNGWSVFVSDLSQIPRMSLSPPEVHLCLSSIQPGLTSEPHTALPLMTDLLSFNQPASPLRLSADAVQSKCSGVLVI